jgi:hypothetical protein
MKKIVLLLCIIAMTCSTLKAQVVNGSISPDFTAVDVEGNEWNLYELLDQDKKVIIHFFAAWEATSWNYYQSAEMQSLDSLYGSLGTEQVQILMVEMEATNGASQLAGPALTSNDHAIATQGDWLNNNPFPVIDSVGIASLLGVTYVPAVIYICPDRLMYTLGQYSADQLETAVMQPACDAASFEVDPMISFFSETSSCETGETFVTIGIKNMGTTSLTSATLELNNGETTLPFPWTGSLTTYESDTLTFGPLELDYRSGYELTVTSQDDNIANSELNVTAGVAMSSTTVVLELLMDAWPGDVSWFIKDENGEVVHEGDNYIYPYQWIKDTLNLPGNGCYTFEMHDASEDGLQGTLWGGFDGRFSLKSFNWTGELVYTIFDYDGSYMYELLTSSFEVNDDIALDVENVAMNARSFNAYPNPTNGILNINYILESSERVSLELRDITGRLMLQRDLGNQMPGMRNEQVSLEELPTGIYMLSVKYGMHVHTTRIVKR